MSILSKTDIMARLIAKDDNRIVVTPILNRDTQINQIGIDCRLSNQFIIFKAQNISSIDMKDFTASAMLSKHLQKEVVIPFNESFILHPQTLVLGSTFEFISLPNDIAASIEGRSSWARTGLMVATASYVEPGFKGCITLELSNVSNIPIKLYPGLRIGQIIFDRTTSASEYAGKKYKYPIGPETTKIGSDIDAGFFLKNKNLREPV
jgi:dCTP deaminase